MVSKADLQGYQDFSRILLKAKDYLYVLPHSLLRPYVANYTITYPDGNQISENYTVIPNGSSTLVFSFDGNEIYAGLFGAATKINQVGEQANKRKVLFIIEFYPHGLYPFLKADQSEMKDCLLPFESVDRTLHREIYQAFEQAADVYALLSQVDQILLACMQNSFMKSELILAMDRIIAEGGRLTVKELADSVYYSERHLNRIFRQFVGVNVKTLLKLVRANKAIRYLQANRGSITKTAYEAGYYDEAHFINEFKSICHITPQSYMKNMSDFYNEIAKF